MFTDLQIADFFKKEFAKKDITFNEAMYITLEKFEMSRDHFDHLPIIE